MVKCEIMKCTIFGMPDILMTIWSIDWGEKHLYKAVDMLGKLTQDILGAINFDPSLKKWEVEDEQIPRTFFSDRKRDFSNAPINDLAVIRLKKLYQSHFGIYKMKEPFDESECIKCANEVLDFLEGLIEKDLSILKNSPSASDNLQKRICILNILIDVLRATQDKEYFECDDELKTEVDVSISNYQHRRGSKAALTPSQEKNYLVEAKGRCTFCDKKIIKENDFDIVESYDFLYMDGTDKIDRENVVVLCKNCYQDFVNGISETDKKKLIDKKRQLYVESRYEDDISDIDLETEIENVINSISMVKPTELTPLNYEPKKVEQKIADDFILMDEVSTKVVKYFNFVSDVLKRVGAERKNKDIFIADEVKKAYLTIEDMPKSKQEKYDTMVTWLMRKTGSTNRKACEIVICYFIQSCEVFKSEDTE